MKKWPSTGGYSTYLRSQLEHKEVKKIIVEICADIGIYPIINTFESIAYTGASGHLIAPIVCYELQKNPIYVRYKDCRIGLIEGKPCKKCIILDDFIHSGTTMRRMLGALEPRCDCVGIYLYNQRPSLLTGKERFNQDKHTFDGVPIIMPEKIIQ